MIAVRPPHRAVIVADHQARGRAAHSSARNHPAAALDPELGEDPGKVFDREYRDVDDAGLLPDLGSRPITAVNSRAVQVPGVESKRL
jgi:hypothetical protein